MKTRTIGNRMFNYNPSLRHIKGANNKKYKAIGVAIHPVHKNVKFVLTDATHSKMNCC